VGRARDRTNETRTRGAARPHTRKANSRKALIINDLKRNKSGFLT
jgi:hypothetical protein